MRFQIRSLKTLIQQFEKLKAQLNKNLKAIPWPKDPKVVDGYAGFAKENPKAAFVIGAMTQYLHLQVAVLSGATIGFPKTCK